MSDIRKMSARENDDVVNKTTITVHQVNKIIFPCRVVIAAACSMSHHGVARGQKQRTNLSNPNF